MEQVQGQEPDDGLIDCQACTDVQIGTEQEPICVTPSEGNDYPDETVCKKCFKELVGREPIGDEIQLIRK